MYNYKRLDPEQCEFVAIGPESELPPGERLFVEIDEHSIVIFNIAGNMYAIADLCSHDNGPLGDGELEGHDIHCPRHGAAFDVRSGKALSLPAIEDIPAYPVRVEQGEILIGLPA
ncbi:MAG TPA: non-heme iron oxygenase ferredoxin subunit [Anaerolineales bacterium]|nr:non-heme iron oxygenase ferredoxin subunit [Anaerolineales bacterium]